MDAGAAGAKRWWLVAVLIVVALVAGCGGGGDDDSSSDDTDGDTPDTAQPVSGGRVVFGINAESDGFNPAGTRYGPSTTSVSRAIYDPIAAIDTEGVARPYLVESIEPCTYDVETGECPDEGELDVWTITLRDQEILFHNGDALTSEILASHIDSVRNSLLTGLALKPIESVQAVDDLHVVVQISQPWATFPAIWTSQIGYVAHPSVYDGSAENPVGTGPFSFDEWVRDDHLTVVRNDSYWREGLPYLDEVEFRPLPDGETRAASLSSGDIDMEHSNSASDLMAVGKDGSGAEDGFTAYFDGSGGEEMHVMLNGQSGPTADHDVRRALALATDREALVEGLYGGFFELADGPYDPSSSWWADAGWPEPDPDEASQIIEEWEAENGPLELRLTMPSSQENTELGQVIAEQWQEVGVDVEVEAALESDFGNRLILGDYDAMLLPFYNRSDPDEHYHFWDPDGIGPEGELSINLARWTNDTVGEALQAARQTADVAEREALYATVWQEWAQEFPYLWIYHGTYVIIADDAIHGLDSFTFPDGEPAEVMDWGAPFLTGVWRE